LREVDTFVALADPIRREVLELLRLNATMTAGEIARQFPNVSRPNVSRHVRVLREAGLVAATVSGREQHYRLDAAPLRTLNDEWLSRFAPVWERSLEKLKQIVETVSDSD
jgi:DNA-binding transcriptional ArsR family regulator